MDSQPLIIRTCRHTLASGFHCQGAAVRGRSCCRHHLDAGTRMRNMARACRRSLKLRFRILDSPRALAINRAEVNRVVATERIDPDAARMMLWAMDLCAVALKAEDDLLRRRNRCCKSNQHYHLSSTPSFSGECLNNHLELLENTGVGGGGAARRAPDDCVEAPASPANRRSFDCALARPAKGAGRQNQPSACSG